MRVGENGAPRKPAYINEDFERAVQSMMDQTIHREPQKPKQTISGSKEGDR